MLGDRARVTSFYQSCLPRLIVVLEKSSEVTAHERCFWRRCHLRYCDVRRNVLASFNRRATTMRSPSRLQYWRTCHVSLTSQNVRTYSSYWTGKQSPWFSVQISLYTWLLCFPENVRFDVHVGYLQLTREQCRRFHLSLTFDLRFTQATH